MTKPKMRIKPMNYKNGDLGMWHTFAEVAGHLKFVAEIQEQMLYSECKFYSYDDSAFEEYCHNEKITRTKDFEAKGECWGCTFYQLQEKMQVARAIKLSLQFVHENQVNPKCLEGSK